MYKTAQERGVLDWLSEKTNIGGIAAEKAPFLNQPGFKDVMDKLRKADDTARSIALGKMVGEGDDPPDPISMKNLLKEATSAFNRREYMTAAAQLGRFHRKLEDIAFALKGFDSDVSAIHEKFILEGLDPETQKHIMELRQKMVPKKASLNKRANIRDFFVNILTERGRALSSWEKRYPEKAKILKVKTNEILKASNKALDEMTKIFKDMATARNKRMVESYDKAVHRMLSLNSKYDALFREYYDKNIKAFADKLSELAEKKKEEVTPESAPESVPSSLKESPELIVPIKLAPDSEVETTPLPSEKIPTAVQSKPQPQFSGSLTPQISISPKAESVREHIPSAPSVPTIKQMIPPSFEPETEEEGMPPTFEAEPSRSTWITGLKPSAASQIINSLVVMSSESPLLLRSYLIKCARQLEKTEPKVSQSLLDIAKRIEV